MFQKFAKAIASSLGFDDEERERRGQFTLTSKLEILRVLRDVMNNRGFIDIKFDNGDGLLSSILAVNDDYVILDCGKTETINHKALASKKLIFTSQHRRVRIRFECAKMQSVMFQGHLAFLIPVPASMVRLQRRESYRLLTPRARPVKCIFPLGSGGGVGVFTRAAEATVLDISGGGIAIISPPQGLTLTIGTIYQNCRIILPDTGEIQTAVQIRNVVELPMKSGSQARRAGCQFVNLDNQSLGIIHRYILLHDRERLARDSGMD